MSSYIYILYTYILYITIQKRLFDHKFGSKSRKICFNYPQLSADLSRLPSGQGTHENYFDWAMASSSPTVIVN